MSLIYSTKVCYFWNFAFLDLWGAESKKDLRSFSFFLKTNMDSKSTYTGEEEMKGMDYFHDRKIYPKRGCLHGIFGRKLHFYLNISFRNSLVHRQTRKSRNDLGKQKDVPSR